MSLGEVSQEKFDSNLARQMREAGKTEEQIKAFLSSLPDRVDKPEIGNHYLVEIFLELNAARQYGMSSPQLIAYSEISSFTQLTGWALDPSDVTILKRMDLVYVNETIKITNKKK